MLFVKKNIYSLSFIVLISFLISVIFKNYLNTNELFYNFYSEQLVQEQLDKLIETQQKWSWVGYAITPLLILLRSSIVALTLSVGNFFYNMDEIELPKFKDFFRIALLGEFVLLFVGVFKLLYFLFIKTDYNLLDIQRYYPLSLINFADIDNLEPWLVYPIQTINLFEITYFIVLVYGMHKLLKSNYWRDFEITAVSYGIGLLIWLGLVTFLILNFT